MAYTVYDLIGGATAVDAAVALFYRKVLADGRVSEFFDGVDMERQIRKQKAFLTMVLGGPVAYTGKDMRAAHAPLVARGLSDSHFDVVVEHLGATLTELGVPPELVGHVATEAEALRRDILGR
ncbi:MAG TPA: group 1 truncated hemoglobin [Kofleriaceae bacterium]|nr:group 1 truncated hemoglobin [Kofleriaceae bacterium]